MSHAGLAPLPENGSRCEPVPADASVGQAGGGSLTSSLSTPVGASSAPPDFSFAMAAKGLFDFQSAAAAKLEQAGEGAVEVEGELEVEEDGRGTSPSVPAASGCEPQALGRAGHTH